MYTVSGYWTNMLILLQGRVVGARRGRRKRTENGSNIMPGQPSLGPLYGTRHSLTIPISRYVFSLFSPYWVPRISAYFLGAERLYSTVKVLSKCQEMEFAVVSKSSTQLDVSLVMTILLYLTVINVTLGFMQVLNRQFNFS